jgi:hypothetical protein
MNRTCLEGGTIHSRVSTGLDVVRDELRSGKRCVWCGRTWSTPYGRPGRAALLRATERRPR